MSTQLTLLDAIGERDRIIASFQENHRTYLEALRAFAREIALRDGVVSIDEVRAEIERREFPMPKDIGADERILGALFASKDFICVGQRPTTRAAWSARVGRARSNVSVYRIKVAA